MVWSNDSLGMGTLHLGDRISGISDPNEINTWIQEAVSLGITLFDLAVSALCHSHPVMCMDLLII